MKVILAILLFVALLDLPYGYYQFLRLVISGSMIYLIYTERNTLYKWKIFVYAALTILFNPIFPIYLTREIWITIDILSGIVLLSTWALVRNK